MTTATTLVDVLDLCLDGRDTAAMELVDRLNIDQAKQLAALACNNLANTVRMICAADGSDPDVFLRAMGAHAAWKLEPT